MKNKYPDSPVSQSAKTPPDDIWDQPALTPRECADRIAKLREEGRLPTAEHLQKAATKAKEDLK